MIRPARVRNVLLIIMLAPPALNLLAMIVLRAHLVSFQRAVPRLRNADDMARFKRLATVQMYATLVVLPTEALPLLVWIYGKFIAGALGWLDLLLYVIVPFLGLTGAAMLLGKQADEVRATPADTPELEKERDLVADVWVNKNFPEW